MRETTTNDLCVSASECVLVDMAIGHQSVLIFVGNTLLNFTFHRQCQVLGEDEVVLLLLKEIVNDLCDVKLTLFC
jgi:hypothetical protein